MPSAPLPAWLLAASLWIVAGLILYWAYKEVGHTEARDMYCALVFIAFAILIPVTYEILAPYYIVTPVATIEYPINYTYTTVVNGSTVTKTVNATKIIHEYQASPVPQGYMFVTITIALVLVMLAFYCILKGAFKASRIPEGWVEE